jgi:hypothetical protein
MPRTRQLIFVSLALVIGIAFGVVLSGAISVKHTDENQYGSVDDLTSHNVDVQTFKVAIETAVTAKQGKGDGGYTPDDIMAALPGLLPEDFNGVHAVLGQYDMKDGQLVYSNEDILDGTAGDVVAKGYEVLRANVYRRLALDAKTAASTAVGMLTHASTTARTTKPVSPIPPPSAAGTICTQDAKQCSDGSYVSRHGVNCEFDVCPGEGATAQSVACKSDQRLVNACTEEYAPVCGAVEVQCIKAPCNPVPKTYPNSCFACMDKSVQSYTAGACTTN